jgi:hypothetical protein
VTSALGIDFSTFAIDLVLVSENANRAAWHHITLHGPDAFERVRTIPANMPPASWYDDHGVYLVGLERPFSDSRNDIIRLAEGAILASIPSRIHAREVAPQTWKAHIRHRGRGKPATTAFPPFLRTPVGGWRQDAIDALGVALYVRDDNADLIAKQLGGDPAAA